jgi:hypothetical protein
LNFVVSPHRSYIIALTFPFVNRFFAQNKNKFYKNGF